MLKIFGHYMERRLLILSLAEGLVLAFCFYIGYFARYADADSITTELIAYLPQAAIFIVACMLSMVTLGLYERGTALDLQAMALRLAAAFIVAFVLVAIVSYVLPGAKIWRSGLFVAMPGAFVAILLLRMLVDATPLARSFARRVMIVGEPASIAKVDAVLASGKHRGIVMVERLSLDDPIVWSNDITTLKERAALADCAEIIVAVEDPHDCQLPVTQLLECRLAGIRLVDLAEFCERETGRVDLDHFQRSWLMFSTGFESGRLDLIGKRVFDVVVSMAVLLLCLPLLLLAMLAIKLEDGGPVLYRQVRVGRHGQAFPLLKLRSMRVDAERLGARFAEANDPRVTRVGRFIRRTRIDELPQLVNVLNGEMSFVGPRPERPIFVRELEHQLPFFKERHRVKPGISGWAQVNHAYTATVEDARVKLEYDIYYMKNWSIFLDFLILAQTLRVVVWGTGAR